MPGRPAGARSGYGVEADAPAPGAVAVGRDALRQLESSLAPGQFVAAEGHNTFTWPWPTPPRAE
jgi:hypothetical protein